MKAMFSSYGSVDDVSILRNADGKSKGAAFVRMGSKDEAKDAITRLNNSQTMPVSIPFPQILFTSHHIFALTLHLVHCDC